MRGQRCEPIPFVETICLFFKFFLVHFWNDYDLLVVWFFVYFKFLNCFFLKDSVLLGGCRHFIRRMLCSFFLLGELSHRELSSFSLPVLALFLSPPSLSLVFQEVEELSFMGSWLEWFKIWDLSTGTHSHRTTPSAILVLFESISTAGNTSSCSCYLFYFSRLFPLSLSLC